MSTTRKSAPATFCEWLFLTAPSITDENDPVRRMAHACRKDIEWPVHKISSKQELLDYLQITGREGGEWQYVAGLAWADYEKYLGQPSEELLQDMTSIISEPNSLDSVKTV